VLRRARIAGREEILGNALLVEHLPAVPGEAGWVGAEGGFRAEGEAAAVEVGELEVVAAGQDGFDEVGLGDADAQVVIDGPEASVEEVVGGRGQVQVILMGSDPMDRDLAVTHPKIGLARHPLDKDEPFGPPFQPFVKVKIAV
jgi:hypothetical protein